MRRGARTTPLVPKELILPVCQRLAFVLFAMCSTALGIRLYARYKLRTLGAKSVSNRLTFPVNGTRYFMDIGNSAGSWTEEISDRLEGNGWKGVCVNPFPNMERQCEAIAMPVVPVDGESVHVEDCSRRDSPAPKPMRVLLSALFDCPTVERAGVGIKSLLKIAKAPRVIDFINLDTQGSEGQILHTFPFDEYCVRSWAVSKGAENDDSSKILTSQNCNVKDAPRGYFARCHCSHFEASFLQVEAAAITPMGPVEPPIMAKREVAAPKVMRKKYNKKWARPPALVVLPHDVQHLPDHLVDENVLLGGASGLGGNLMRRSFA